MSRRRPQSRHRKNRNLWPSTAVASAMLSHHAYAQLEQAGALEPSHSAFALPERADFGRAAWRSRT